jgi:hypothetical protein
MSNEAYNLPGKQRLVALINKDNEQSFSLDMFRFGIPEVSFSSRNTKVRFIAKPGLFFVGSREFFYNRLNLSTFFFSEFSITELTLPIRCNTTLEMAVAINAIYGTAIEEVDIVLEPVYGLYHVLKSVPSSLAWTGQVVVIMTEANPFDIANIIQVQIMDGLSFPAI